MGERTLGERVMLLERDVLTLQMRAAVLDEFAERIEQLERRRVRRPLPRKGFVEPDSGKKRGPRKRVEVEAGNPDTNPG